MRVLFHMTGVMLFIGLFLVGNLLVKRRGSFAQALRYLPVSNKYLCKFFLYCGETFKVVASVGGFLEAVAALILMSGVLVDALVGI